MGNRILLKGVIWKFFERIGVFGTQFIIQIILARILSPSDYGALAIMLVFITISNTLIQTGFNTALIQRKDTKECDYSSVLWVTVIFSFILYALIYMFAPVIAGIYDSTHLVWPLRVIALILFPGTLNSVQLAKVTKELDFKKIFYSNLIGAIISGGVGIIIAMRGGGLWALVAQYLINTTVCCIVMLITVRIRFEFRIETERIKSFLSYGWKLIVSSLLNTLSEQLNSIIIGYKFSTESLGFYTRGMQFPNYAISVVEGTMTGVLLPSISKVQDDKTEAKTIMKNAMLLSTYLVFPVLGGLSVASSELIKVLLTDKWLGCVPYLQVFCGVFALYPVHVCNLQTLNALGRSDLFMKLEIIKKVYSISFIVLMIILFDTPLAVAVCTFVISPVGWFVNSYPNRKLINYSFFEQVKDLIPSFLCTLVMMIFVYPCSFIKAAPIIVLLVKVLSGIIIYIAISIITKNNQFKTVLYLVMSMVKGRFRA